MNSPAQLPFDFSTQGLSCFDDFLGTDANAELLALFLPRIALSEQCYFIWGTEGAGKTHLLQAICQSQENSVYVPLKKFFEQGSEILQGLENMDLVCLDDIDIILGDRAWEEGLFKFFNEIRERGNKLLMSASSSPRGLNSQLADLGSRLGWGVVYQLHALDDKDKAQALKRWVANRGIPLNDEVLDYILSRNSRSMTALFNVLETLDQLSLAEKRRITIPFVKAMMGW